MSFLARPIPPIVKLRDPTDRTCFHFPPPLCRHPDSATYPPNPRFTAMACRTTTVYRPPLSASHLPSTPAKTMTSYFYSTTRLDKNAVSLFWRMLSPSCLFSTQVFSQIRQLVTGDRSRTHDNSYLYTCSASINQSILPSIRCPPRCAHDFCRSATTSTRGCFSFQLILKV